LKGDVTPLERGKKPNVVDDIRSTCPKRKKKPLFLFLKIKKNHGVDVSIIIII
jgi:hypothetical protein